MVKYIKGSWFEFQHPDKTEGTYWNDTCRNFTDAQWELKIKETKELGMEYLVLMATALDERAYFKTDIYPKAELAAAEPLEAILKAADKYGIKLFISSGFFGDWRQAKKNMVSSELESRTFNAMEELAALYGNHPSFYGWYFPDEAFIDKYFSEEYMECVNHLSEKVHLLMPKAKTLIAPYGTRVVIPDDKYVKQLSSLDVDFIAYQDEIGVRKTKVEESEAFYKGLRKAHDKAGRAALWADVEVFEFEGAVYKSPLLPAEFSRVEKQLEAVSPYVDVVLIYQFQGMMNKSGSEVFSGYPDSAVLYNAYRNWLMKNYPSVIKGL